ncbi:STAS domain-containing protein [Pelomonas sp. SE-A7]|uniref:STAS domain-containing protein n=1 Tax=Pelomonas sp. SE-A7 TaxID=3054953 RepID=UPI00259CF43D|nr:STAS domain-containing protein [Pelomonas sp. SE-A7]MDM4766904.1 STAS domain-containing protein [Pelomonas sp. SE-A7]
MLKTLSGELTIYRAAELKDELLRALDDCGGMLELDLSQVSELDSAGLQLLMLLKQLAVQRRHELHLLSHSPAVVEVFELLNVAAFFGDPLVIPQNV